MLQACYILKKIYSKIRILQLLHIDTLYCLQTIKNSNSQIKLRDVSDSLQLMCLQPCIFAFKKIPVNWSKSVALKPFLFLVLTALEIIYSYFSFKKDNLRQFSWRFSWRLITTKEEINLVYICVFLYDVYLFESIFFKKEQTHHRGNLWVSDDWWQSMIMMFVWNYVSSKI